jgi:hypothetical protein
VSTGGVYKFADIPSSRIPNIYDPEGPIPNPNPEESCFPLVKNSTIVRVVIASAGAGVFTSAARRSSCCGPGSQQPEPEQLFPVSTPAAILPAIHPVTPPPPVTFRLPATQPRTIVRVITQIRCGPGNSQFAAGALSRTIHRFITQPRRIPVTAGTQNTAVGYAAGI